MPNSPEYKFRIDTTRLIRNRDGITDAVPNGISIQQKVLRIIGSMVS